MGGRTPARYRDRARQSPRWSAGGRVRRPDRSAGEHDPRLLELEREVVGFDDAETAASTATLSSLTSWCRLCEPAGFMLGVP
jgi:hypothetical protein